MAIFGKMSNKTITKGRYPYAKPLWENVYLRFARGSGDRVHIFQSGTKGVILDSVWRNIGYPELARRNVNIEYHTTR